MVSGKGADLAPRAPRLLDLLPLVSGPPLVYACAVTGAAGIIHPYATLNVRPPDKGADFVRHSRSQSGRPFAIGVSKMPKHNATHPIMVASLDVAAFLIAHGHQPIGSRTMDDGIIQWAFAPSPELFALFRSWREKTGEGVPFLHAFVAARRSLSSELRRAKAVSSQ
jgi:hypothetical protein